MTPRISEMKMGMSTSGGAIACAAEGGEDLVEQRRELAAQTLGHGARVGEQLPEPLGYVLDRRGLTAPLLGFVDRKHLRAKLF